MGQTKMQMSQKQRKRIQFEVIIALSQDDKNDRVVIHVDIDVSARCIVTPFKCCDQKPYM